MTCEVCSIVSASDDDDGAFAKEAIAIRTLVFIEKLCSIEEMKESFCDGHRALYIDCCQDLMDVLKQKSEGSG